MSDVKWHNLDTLILVAGHAIYNAPDFKEPVADESWILQEFQKGEPQFYIEHIKHGMELTKNNENALLVFSGGQTRLEAGARSEAQSYWMLAEHVVGWDDNVRSRATTEEYARDSFENVLLGICRFFEATNRFPKKIKVVGWRFKQKRFGMHRNAIRFPENRYEYVGVNNPHDIDGAIAGEKTAIDMFNVDPYGIRIAPPGEDRRIYLGEKRIDRNPFRRGHPYSSSCKPVADILAYRETAAFDGPLPW